MEGGTLQQLRNLIGRRNIGSETDVKGHVNEIEDFLELVIRCHLIEATLHFFAMRNTTDTPHANTFPPGFASLPFHKRKELFFDRLLRIIDRYVIPKQFLLEQSQQLQQPSPEDVHRNPHFQRVTHEHMYGVAPPPRDSNTSSAIDNPRSTRSSRGSSIHPMHIRGWSLCICICRFE